jgi:hypothetical protein
MNLIDVDVISSEPLQRVLDLAHDASAAAIAKYLPALPFEADLGGNDYFIAQATLCYRFANDFLRSTKLSGISACETDLAA